MKEMGMHFIQDAHGGGASEKTLESKNDTEI